MADRIVDIGGTSLVVLSEQPYRKTATLINYSDASIFLGLGVPAVVGAGIELGPNGDAYYIDRARSTFTPVYVAAIQGGAGPKQLGLIEEVWDVNDAPQLRQLSDVSFFDEQAGDAVIYSAADDQMENGPILFGQSWELTSVQSAGLYREPIEIPSDWKLLSVRIHSKSGAGSLTVDLHSADFGAAFSSIIGAGTKPSLDVANGAWFEDVTFAGWQQTAGFIASWLWLEIIDMSVDSALVSLSFQRTAQPIA